MLKRLWDNINRLEVQSGLFLCVVMLVSHFYFSTVPSGILILVSEQASFLNNQTFSVACLIGAGLALLTPIPDNYIKRRALYLIASLPLSIFSLLVGAYLVSNRIINWNNIVYFLLYFSTIGLAFTTHRKNEVS